MRDLDITKSDFPFDEISKVAEQESWRKEVYRPLSYMHKWWARRLGSVFRGLALGGIDSSADFMNRYYSNTRYPMFTVYDPFMGSGTTIHEATKLGAKVAGCDINPVAVTLVRTAINSYSRNEIEKTFKEIEDKCKAEIQYFYTSRRGIFDEKVLYYFWIRTVTCECGNVVPLFQSTIFSKNAYPTKKPIAQSICPYCGEINQVHYQAEDCECKGCERHYNPQKGNVEKFVYTCPYCGKKEKIIDYVRRTKKILSRKMYAKMVFNIDGEKEYVRINDFDLERYKEAEDHLSKYEDFIPNDEITAGHNTNQILNYNYHQWREMFNARQLLSFGILSKAISEIESTELRQLFSILMSGTLEFNNMFCSFKGEGTGAVRPLFYNHILKSELAPLEANVWGGKGSSGAFSNLYETRVIRAFDYKERPYEIKIDPSKKVEKFYLDGLKIEKHATRNINRWDVDHPLILCGDSGHSPLPDKCIDLVLTDPPFFDNVNYSELADFFFVWLRRFGEDDVWSKGTTRSKNEVQDNDAEKFSEKLKNVFGECHRVLKDDGALVFTYHHSRIEGWASVYNSISRAGFSIEKVFPIKAEMAVSVSIMASKQPINYDLVFVCGKKKKDYEMKNTPIHDLSNYEEIINRFNTSDLKFSKGDKLVALYGTILMNFSNEGKETITEQDIESAINELSLD